MISISSQSQNEESNLSDNFQFPYNSLKEKKDIIFDFPPQTSNLIEEENYFPINNLFEISTKYKDEDKNNSQNKVIPIFKDEKNGKEEFLYSPYTITQIKEILKNPNIQIIINEEYLKEAESKFLTNKRKRKKNIENSNEENKENNFCVLIENEEGKKKKKGRKPIKNKETIIDHDKFSPDNIIRRVKVKLFQYLIIFVNNVIDNKEQILYNLNHKKYINRIKKEDDLKYLNMKIKDLLSMEITSKNKTKNYNKNYNKEIIEQIQLKKEKESINSYRTRMFALNMKFREWIQLFTLKKSVNDLINLNYSEENKNVNIKKIESSLINIYDLLEDIEKMEEIKYFSFFIFYLFNFERYFFLKKERNNSKKKFILIKIA